jgi:hypothetical protein
MDSGAPPGAAKLGFAKADTAEALCALLGFPDPEIPKCDESRYSKCIPAPFCGEELTDAHEGRAGGVMRAVCPVAWVASTIRNQKSNATVWELRHVDGLGHEASIPVEALGPPNCRDRAADKEQEWNELDPDYPYDYDGDGEPELLLLQHAGTFDAGFPGILLTVKDGAARVYYVPPKGYYIDGTTDYDKDHVPDLSLKFLLGGDWEEGCGGYGEAQWSSQFIAHARPDGTFDMSDPVAAAAVREWCPRKPAKLGSKRDKVGDKEDILCALLWHVPVRALERKYRCEMRACERVQAEEADEPLDGCGPPERCNDEKAQIELVHWQPPLFLDGQASQ